MTDTWEWDQRSLFANKWITREAKSLFWCRYNPIRYNTPYPPFFLCRRRRDCHRRSSSASEKGWRTQGATGGRAAAAGISPRVQTTAPRFAPRLPSALSPGPTRERRYIDKQAREMSVAVRHRLLSPPRRFDSPAVQHQPHRLHSFRGYPLACVHFYIL